MSEVPLFRCDVNGNGYVDSNDYVLAFVTGLSDWSYDTSRRNFTYVLDNYDDNRHYWFVDKPAGDGATMGKFTQPAGQGDTVGYFINRVMYGEPDKQPQQYNEGALGNIDGDQFIWKQISPNNPFSYPLALPNLDTTVGGSIIFTEIPTGNNEVNATVGNDTFCQGCGSGMPYPVSNWGNDTLTWTYTGTDVNYWQLQSMQVDYQSHLVQSGNTVPIFSFSDPGVKTFRVPDNGSGRRLFSGYRSMKAPYRLSIPFQPRCHARGAIRETAAFATLFATIAALSRRAPPS